MKYITTDTHPQFKEGIRVKMAYAIEDNMSHIHTDVIESDCIYVNQELLTNSINQGYIKEVHGKEFTLNDVLEIIEHYNMTVNNPVDSHDVFMNWKNTNMR